MLGHSATSVVGIRIRVSRSTVTICHTSKLVVTAPANDATCGLSGNNPVVTPSTRALYLATMTPRDLAFHPVIITSDTIFALSIADHDGDFLLTVSNHDRALSRNIAVAIQGTPYTIAVIGLPRGGCFSALHRGVV